MREKVQLKHSEDYYLKTLLSTVKLKEIMTSPVVSIDLDASFKEVPKKFAQFGIRHLPVVTGGKKLVGLISQRDLFRIQPPHKTLDGDLVYDEDALDGVVLKHVMVQEPFFMNQNDSLGNAIVAIVEKKYGCIPIVNEKMELQGIVTQMDMLKVAGQIFQE
ncbi:MAG TPA: CBS domain-containing protein [Candidatus Bathyarchaeia archaeon]|nr:CBS domain-containing protein [Candidatus Bathyarchaeia archaeon]